MNIVEMRGGLGNQMFQAALYLAFREKNIPVLADLSFYDSGRQERELGLDFFPELSLELADADAAAALRGYGYHDSVWKKVKRKLHPAKPCVYEEDVRKGFQPEVFDQRERYLSGYWQCEKYFAEYRKDILASFRFPAVREGSHCQELEQQILREDQPVSLHVRRGDYLDERYANVYRDVCTEQYYRNAMKCMETVFPDCHFFVFSDDMSWCREHFEGENLTFVDCNQGKESPYDMYLMSICRHNIIANSSFSWWGAWLNQNEQKMVLAPERWFHHMDVCDQICESWKRISIV